MRAFKRKQYFDFYFTHFNHMLLQVIKRKPGLLIPIIKFMSINSYYTLCDGALTKLDYS